MRKRFTVMIIPHRGGGTRQGLFSLWHVALCAAAALGFVVLLVYCLAYGGYLHGGLKLEAAKWKTEAQQAQGLLEDAESAREGMQVANAQLNKTVDSQQARLDELEEKAALAMSLLSGLQDREKEIIDQMGLSGGVGGSGEVVAMAGDNYAIDTYDYIINTAQESILEYSKLEELIYEAEEQANIPNEWPLDGNNVITSGYGVRLNPITRSGYEFHGGIDISARAGEDVLAAGGGTVTFSGYDSIYGYMIIIDHGNGYVSQYGHCSSLLAKEGDLLEKGQVIALSGNTGRSTGPHLDFRISRDGDNIDPLTVLDK